MNMPNLASRNHSGALCLSSDFQFGLYFPFSFTSSTRRINWPARCIILSECFSFNSSGEGYFIGLKSGGRFGCSPASSTPTIAHIVTTREQLARDGRAGSCRCCPY